LQTTTQIGPTRSVPTSLLDEVTEGTALLANLRVDLPDVLRSASPYPAFVHFSSLQSSACRFGIDGLSIIAPINYETGKQRYADQQRKGGVPWKRIPPDMRGLLGCYYYWHDHAYYVLVWMNPARLADPHGWEACPVEDVYPLIEAQWDGLASDVQVECDLDDVRVARLDLCQDFVDVADPDVFLKRFAIESLVSKRLKLGLSSGSSGRYLTLGNDRGGQIALYNKSDETRHRARSRGIRCAPPGTLRFEAQCRGWLRSHTNEHGAYIEGLADIDVSRVDALGRYWWSQSRMGTPIVDYGRFLNRLDVVAERDEISLAVKQRIAGAALYAAQGDATALRSLSHKSRVTATQLIAEVGLPSLGGANPHDGLRLLDPVLGREVTIG